jgi:malonate transporter MadL subunit
MIIYGTALLAVCHLLGIFIGDLLGQALGVKTNVGGVGIAMLLLIFARIYMQKKDMLPKLTELGVEYWGAMYIPVVVAMAAQQDMVSALRGGPVALLSAIGAAALCAVVIAAINRSERPAAADEPAPAPILHDNPLLAEAE